MKKYTVVILALLLALSLTMSSCLGSLALTNKVRVWIRQISNKFINELVYVGLWIVPVYETCFISDILVLNSIEFWSGKNPINSVSEKKVVHGEHNDFSVVSTPTGYKITNLSDSSSCELIHCDKNDSWLMQQRGKTVKLFNYVDKGHVSMPDGAGHDIVVSLDADGVMAYQQCLTRENLVFAHR